jgi:ATPases of the AAA+ class
MGSKVENDRAALQKTMKAIIEESKRKAAAQQPQLPGLDRSVAVQAIGLAQTVALPLPEHIAELVYEIPAKRRLDDLVLSDEVVSEVKEFLHEYAHAALLRDHSIEPRHTVMLVGPPGNGKTSLAEAFAAELSLPLLSIRYDAIVDSYLGETSNRLRRLIDYATLNPCVLFFDEFDAVGKERSDAQETGEIKRVVSSLLMQMDRLPSHAIVACATNHPELLDRAVWRRFELKLEINRPNKKQLKSWFSRLRQSLGNTPIGVSEAEFIACMDGENMSEVEAFTLDVRRKIILSRGQLSAAEAVKHVLARLKKRAAPAITTRSLGDHGDQLSNSPPAPRKRQRKANQGDKTTLSKKASLSSTG